MSLKLLMLADDLTGAMDSSVFFAEQGFKTLIAVTPAPDAQAYLASVPDEIEVLAVNTLSRHIAPADAHRIVTDWIGAGRDRGIPYMYKKTDSALRGNVAAELSAAYRAHGSRQLPFVPALPGQNRVCRDGKLLIGGVPVNETDLGQDPFTPVPTAVVRDLVQYSDTLDASDVSGTSDMPDASKASDRAVPVHGHPYDGKVSGENGICIYDAWENGQLQVLAEQLKENGMLAVSAGSGGFARFLAGVIGTPEEIKNTPAGSAKEKTMVICGSLSAAAKTQIAFAREAGFDCIPFGDALGEADIHAWERAEEELLRKAAAFLESERIPIFYTEKRQESAKAVDTTDMADAGSDVAADAAGSGRVFDMADRETVAARMAHFTGKVLRCNHVTGVAVFGGDTLAAIVQELHAAGIMPEKEVLPGVIRGRIALQKTDDRGDFAAGIDASDKEEMIRIWTKAGSFGGADLIPRLVGQEGS